MNQSFSKTERIKKRKPIEDIFNFGESINCFPFKAFYRFSKNVDKKRSFAQGVFVVPKRLFNKAVDRNNIRRKMKEAFRKNKQDLYKELYDNNQKLEFAVIYIATKNIEFENIESEMLVLIKALIKNRLKAT